MKLQKSIADWIAWDDMYMWINNGKKMHSRLLCTIHNWNVCKTEYMHHWNNRKQKKYWRAYCQPIRKNNKKKHTWNGKSTTKFSFSSFIWGIRTLHFRRIDMVISIFELIRFRAEERQIRTGKTQSDCWDFCTAKIDCWSSGEWNNVQLICYYQCINRMATTLHRNGKWKIPLSHHHHTHTHDHW